uniref:G-protein coupled receptors family 1 profile domain-containing protein n=1 Tax=Megaselia scalaris TaxID=36166 RepID=T1GIV3_MEGSC
MCILQYRFILYSSLSSFYIPCIMMVFLYWSIFKALRNRARKQKAAKRPHLSEITCGSVIENVAQTRRYAETTLDSSKSVSRIVPDEPATNTGSGSNEDEDENAISPEEIEACHVIVNDKSTEFMLATVVEETGKKFPSSVVAQISSNPQLVVSSDANGNHDSGYVPSNIGDSVVIANPSISSPPQSPEPSGSKSIAPSSTASVSAGNTNNNKQPQQQLKGKEVDNSSESPKKDSLSMAMKPLSYHVKYETPDTLDRNDSTMSAFSKTSRKDKRNSQASR